MKFTHFYTVSWGQRTKRKILGINVCLLKHVGPMEEILINDRASQLFHVVSC